MEKAPPPSQEPCPQAWRAAVVLTRFLPHCDMDSRTQTVTFRLYDSLPQSLLDEWREELRLLPEREANRERRQRIDACLDRGLGSCFLKDNRLAEIVHNALLHHDGTRYVLHA